MTQFSGEHQKQWDKRDNDSMNICAEEGAAEGTHSAGGGANREAAGTSNRSNG